MVGLATPCKWPYRFKEGNPETLASILAGGVSSSNQSSDFSHQIRQMLNPTSPAPRTGG